MDEDRSQLTGRLVVGNLQRACEFCKAQDLREMTLLEFTAINWDQCSCSFEGQREALPFVLWLCEAEHIIHERPYPPGMEGVRRYDRGGPVQGRLL